MSCHWILAVWASLEAIQVSADLSGQEGGNELCWYNSDRSYARCCIEADPECWMGIWVTADLCCYPMSEQQQQCYDALEARAEAKMYKLRKNIEMIEMNKLQTETGDTGGSAPLDPELLSAFLLSFEVLLAQPLSFWAWACSAPSSPLLWSPECACCDPVESTCVEADPTEIQHSFLKCCYPIYTRKVQEPPDAALEASIQTHLETLTPSRHRILNDGPKLVWDLKGEAVARGCVISVHANGTVSTCSENHACHGFDCSFLRAVRLALEVIQAINPLPAFDFVLNAADETLQNTIPDAPVFTRGGSSRTHTIILPFEWQMHPAQCVRTVKVGMNAVGLVKWEDRKNMLLWRGSHSNLWSSQCKMFQAARDHNKLADCISPDTRAPIWNFSTWLQMPRGRLVMSTRYLPNLIDAKFVDSNVAPMSEDLEQFLRDEGLFGERIEGEYLADYKYHIAIEGNCAADRVVWQPFLGSVLLIPDGPWVHLPPIKIMQPWLHYVPVMSLDMNEHCTFLCFETVILQENIQRVDAVPRYDLSDLIEKLLWLQSHDKEAKAIALNAATFAHREGTVYYLDRLFRAYAEKLTA